jgi:hypothetical protein
MISSLSRMILTGASYRFGGKVFFTLFFFRQAGYSIGFGEHTDESVRYFEGEQYDVRSYEYFVRVVDTHDI